MGRELKRVPLDFDWPMKKVWDGYLQKRKKEPPKGKGFQLWENVTEGSPVSPVFKTLDELCVWAENNATTFANYKTTKENWKKMLTDGQVYHEAGNIIFI